MGPLATAQQGSIERFLQPVLSHAEQTRHNEQQTVSQTYLWPIYSCQQILAAELGWPASASIRSWQQVQARQQLSLLQLLPVYASTSTLQRHEVSVLALQQQDNSHTANSTLAAVGYHNGMIHLVKEQELIMAAQQSNGSSPAPAAQVHSQPTTSAVPAGCVWTINTADKLISCCWAPPGSEFAEMVTAGAQSVHIRRFVQGRHHEYELKYRSPPHAAMFRQVSYLDKGAAYTVVALRQGELMLWDCRAASRAVAQLSISQSAELFRTLPGGQVVLTATSEGEMSLYDVRRISNSTNSSVINFGGSRKSQQLIASYNVPARVDEAAVVAAGHPNTAVQQSTFNNSRSSSMSGQPYRVHPFFRDVQLNPADCNLVAYVRPDLQVGVFDLYQNRVLQQVCVAEAVSSSAGLPAVQVDRAGQAPARCCWDPEGRIVYSHGLLKHSGSMDKPSVQLQPTVVAIDFGSWRNRRLRQESSSHWMFREEQHPDTSDLDSLQFSRQQHTTTEASEGQSSRLDDNERCDSGFMSGAGIMCQGGQVQHLPLGRLAVPTELAACQGGELLLGTLQGDVLCVR